MAASNPLPHGLESRQQQRSRLMGMTAWERHKFFVNNFQKFYGGSRQQQGAANLTVKTDFDTLAENYRFIRSAEDDAQGGWEVQLARKYYDKLFKEYCIGDLSRYKEGKLGLRWRTQKEVVAGKGQFVCGAKGCEEREGLASFEVSFAYVEAGEHKVALVKLRLCPKHAMHLNYQKNQRALQEQASRARRSGEKSRNAGSKKEAKKSKKRSREQRTPSAEREKVPDEEVPPEKRAAADPMAHQPAAKSAAGDNALKSGSEFEEFFAGLFA